MSLTACFPVLPGQLYSGGRTMPELAIDTSDKPTPKESCTFICSRDTMDGVYPALILAINSRRLGMDASIFYTFMGINVIRKGGAAGVKFVPGGTMGAIPGMSSFASWMMRKKMS